MKNIISTKYLLGICLLILVFSSCRKDEIDETVQTPIEQTENINFSISGVLTDKLDIPIANTTVSIDGNSTITDSNGFYGFNNINAAGPRVQIALKHDEYFKTFKTIRAENNSYVHVNAIMDKLENPKNISSSSGGIIEIEGDFSIEFPANAFVKEDGNIYNGDVKVFSTKIDPTENNAGDRFPSDFEILDNDINLQLMQVFSCIGIELYGINNEKLQINKPTNLKMPIPSSLIATAPQEIILGHFDEDLGIWKEEGMASKEGNSYSAEVNQFSYWCALIKQASTYFHGSIMKDLNNDVFADPLKDLYVKLSINSVISGSTRTSGNGSFNIKVPAGYDLKLEVFANSFNSECGEAIYTEMIPALTGPLFLEPILLMDAPNFISISGLAYDCNNQLLDAGYILLKNPENKVIPGYVDAEGKFSLTLYTCDDPISLNLYDINFTTESETLYFPNTDEDIYLSNLIACEPTSTPPYTLRIINDLDTLISSGEDMNLIYNYNAGKLTGFKASFFDIDIINTTQALYEGSCSFNIGVNGFEEAMCEISYADVGMPLKDDLANAYIARMIPTSYPESEAFVYNCIDNMEYVHISMTAILESSLGIPTTHRDPLTYVDFYLLVE